MLCVVQVHGFKASTVFVLAGDAILHSWLDECHHKWKGRIFTVKLKKKPNANSLFLFFSPRRKQKAGNTCSGTWPHDCGITTPWVKEFVFFLGVVIYLDPEIMLAAASVIPAVSDVCATYWIPKSAFYMQSEDILACLLSFGCKWVFQGLRMDFKVGVVIGCRVRVGLEGYFKMMQLGFWAVCVSVCSL